MLNIALIGCGKIADQHMLAIQRIPDCRVVALCDRDILMARQLGERFGVERCFADSGRMFREVSPDVVHITTPPASHFELARQCLAVGCHVYVEKPFTVTAKEAIALIELAQNKQLKITAGHNLQFTLEMQEMRRLVQQGFLGGRPVHLESHFSYDLSDADYVGAVLGTPDHWVRRLPGQLFHNLISHGIARLAEFLDDLEHITIQAFQSQGLTAIGEASIQDELRVLLRDRSNTTAFFCFTTSIRPGLNQFRLHGPENSLVVDIAHGLLLPMRNRSYKSYLTYVIPPVNFSRAFLRNAWSNIVNFLRQRLHQDFGMRDLIAAFYQAVEHDTEPPISYRELLLTARIMDAIFQQLQPLKEPPTGKNFNYTLEST